MPQSKSAKFDGKAVRSQGSAAGKSPAKKAAPAKASAPKSAAKSSKAPPAKPSKPLKADAKGKPAAQPASKAAPKAALKVAPKMASKVASTKVAPKTSTAAKTKVSPSAQVQKAAGKPTSAKTVKPTQVAKKIIKTESTSAHKKATPPAPVKATGVKAPASKASVTPEASKPAAKAKAAVTDSKKKTPAVKKTSSTAGSAKVPAVAAVPVEPPLRRVKKEPTDPWVIQQRDKIYQLRDSILESMHGVAKDTLRSRAEGSEASAFGMHQADAGSDAYDRDFALSLLSQEQDALYEIEEALERIDYGTYGICEMSGKVIMRARLEALPFARYTVECQAEVERQKKLHKARMPVTSLFGLTDEESAESEEEDQALDSKE